ncbi:GTPase-activating protein [Recurvomyces mirabilis]|uniref:Cercosporin MFS transporter CTB4 n=1 Tax=Recurvomyces mirabilis TaxID=574656 RepID=A0AAE0WIM6_9PEZI|nr:GTPase-activating protein [Recurvomyces mirabilis]KAK5154330.1 GTPase-activating protein [Recurvomyces mirabilis]
MADTLKDSLFAAIVRVASGRRLLRFEDEHDEKKRDEYLYGRHSTFTNGATPTPQSSSDTTLTDHAIPPTDPDRAEKGEKALLVEWLEDDPHNPLNWSATKKTFVMFNICFLTTSVYIGSAIYTAGLQGVMEQFHISQTVAILGLTLYVAGYGLGPMLWAPMSEVPFFGRNPIYVGTLFVFVALNFGVVYAKNTGMLLAFRFLTGFFGSPVLATGGASIADLYKPAKRPYALAIYGMANVLGPVLGPLVGGFAAEAKGWKWTIWELIWLSGTALVWLFFTLPETSAGNILYRRTKRLRKHLPAGVEIECEAEIEARLITPREGLMMTFVRPFTLTFCEPILLVLNLYIALVYALLYLWLESIPLAFEGIYHFSLGLTGVAYSGLLVGAIITLVIFFVHYRWRVEPQFDENGDIHPEARLTIAFAGAFGLPICLFMFGWTARPDIHWIVPIIGTSFFSFGAFCLFMAVLSYIGDAYPKYIASVYAGNDLFRSAFGAAFPIIAGPMFRKLGLDWGNSLLGFISILFIPAPFIIYWKGPAIRRRSKAARHDI